mgnify:CR=1 FL=1
MNANLLHNWLRDPRVASDDASENEASDFLRVEIEGAVSAPGHQIAALAPDMPLSAQRVDITLSDGRRILVELDLSRFDAAPIAHLSDLSFEGQGAFPAQC